MVRARKGFTLVELLIVIVIIGILASAMMLSGGSATAAAEASNVISDLRSMKAAALMFFADSMDDIGSISTLQVTYLAPYMDNPDKFTTGGSPYRFANGGAGLTNKWFVGYALDQAKKSPEVKKKLQGKARSTGLLAGTGSLSTTFTTGTMVWMVAR